MAAPKKSPITPSASIEAKVAVKTQSIQLESLKHQQALAELAKTQPDVADALIRMKTDTELEIETAKIAVLDELKGLEDRLASYQNDFEAKKEALEEELETYKTYTSHQIKELDKDVEKAKVENGRTLESLIYEHRKAIERDNIATANAIANSLGLVVVNGTEYRNITEEMKSLGTQLAEVTKSKDGTINQLIAAKGELKDVKSGCESQIALITAEKNMLFNALTDAKADIVRLNNIVANIPAQIAEALKSAKHDVNVTNSGK